MQFEFLHQFVVLPGVDLPLDEPADAGAVLGDERRHRIKDLLVDPVLDLRVGVEPCSERAHQLDQLAVDG